MYLFIWKLIIEPRLMDMNVVGAEKFSLVMIIPWIRNDKKAFMGQFVDDRACIISCLLRE